MRIIKIKSTFKVESQSNPGTFYFVDPERGTCTCPEYCFRMARIGGMCKHLIAVEEREKKAISPTVLSKDAREKERKRIKTKVKEQVVHEDKVVHFEEVRSFVRLRGEVDSVTLIDKFSKHLIDDMIRLGELIEEDGRIRLLE